MTSTNSVTSILQWREPNSRSVITDDRPKGALVGLSLPLVTLAGFPCCSTLLIPSRVPGRGRPVTGICWGSAAADSAHGMLTRKSFLQISFHSYGQNCSNNSNDRRHRHLRLCPEVFNTRVMTSAGRQRRRAARVRHDSQVVYTGKQKFRLKLYFGMICVT